MVKVIFFFFFSSRRRHTRYWRDWSSDVCSSDLETDRRRRRDDAVHRRGQQRELEEMRSELPADVDVLRVARPTARDDRDVIEPVRMSRLLAAPDLYIHVPPPGCKKPRLDGSPGPEEPCRVTPLKWQSIV